MRSQVKTMSPQWLLWLPNLDFKLSRSISRSRTKRFSELGLKIQHCTIVTRPVIISEEKFKWRSRRSINSARSCCGPLSYFSLQIDGQLKSWSSHIFLEEKGPFTPPYFSLLLIHQYWFSNRFLLNLACVYKIHVEYKIPCRNRVKILCDPR